MGEVHAQDAGQFSSTRGSVPRVAFVTLGCAKNEVDSDAMRRRTLAAGYAVEDDPQHADAVVVNTCAFLEAAVEESLGVIFDLAETKRPDGTSLPVIVAGCMPARYGADLEGELVEASAFVPCKREDDIASVLASVIGPAESGAPSREGAEERCPVSAYVKISDGCDRFCSYCAIPYIRGRYGSFAFDDIDADTTITARYIRVHDVVFYDHDGRELSRQSVDHGSAATDPGIPPLDGYTASGWDTSFISVTKDLSVHPVYKPIISVRVPTLVACTIMPDGSVVEPTGYRIENRSVVPVTASDMATEYLADDVSVEMADDSGCIYRTGKMVGRLGIAEESSQCFTWHIGDLDPRENADLIGQAVKEPTTVCRVTFTFEEAA